MPGCCGGFGFDVFELKKISFRVNHLCAFWALKCLKNIKLRERGANHRYTYCLLNDPRFLEQKEMRYT